MQLQPARRACNCNQLAAHATATSSSRLYMRMQLQPARRACICACNCNDAFYLKVCTGQDRRHRHTQRAAGNSSAALDGKSVVLQQPTLDAVNKGRRRRNKEWEFQRWARMGKEVR
jgi:hypothetical protein